MTPYTFAEKFNQGKIADLLVEHGAIKPEPKSEKEKKKKMQTKTTPVKDQIQPIKAEMSIEEIQKPKKFILVRIDSEGRKIPLSEEELSQFKEQNNLKHMVKNANINSENLINMLIYIDRLCKKNKIMLNYSNIYILSALVITLKYNEDHYFTNRYYSSIGGIRNKDLNLIEYHFLTLIDFSLYIKPSEYSRYYTNLSRLLKLKQ